jgi:S1-C subfamily serine protease
LPYRIPKAPYIVPHFFLTYKADFTIFLLRKSNALSLKAATSPKKSRKVSLGTIPDFAYSGEGFRISGVVPGSPAESGGLKAGDVIVRIGSRAVHDLKGLSDLLSRH